MNNRLIKDSNQKRLFFDAANYVLEQIILQSPTSSNLLLGLCGGRSIVNLLTELKPLLQSLPEKTRQKLKFIMVDERIVPLDSPDSNFGLLKNCFFDELFGQHLLNTSQVYPFSSTEKDCHKDIKLYQELFESFGGKFNLAVCGAGEDGHIAGIFPNHSSLLSTEKFCCFNDSPKPPPLRMTATKNLLLQSNAALGLFIGEGKRQALENYLNPSVTIADCPAKIISQIPDYRIYSDII